MECSDARVRVSLQAMDPPQVFSLTLFPEGWGPRDDECWTWHLQLFATGSLYLQVPVNQLWSKNEMDALDRMLFSQVLEFLQPGHDTDMRSGRLVQ